MSGDFYHGGGGSSGSDGSSFSNNNDSHGVNQRAAFWKEFADSRYEEYLSNCPGGPAVAGSTHAHATGQEEQSNTVS